MDCISIYKKSISGCKRLTREEQYRLGRLKQNGDRDAYQKLIESILPLAMQIAGKYKGRGADHMDLLQAANMGAMRAVSKYNPDNGCMLTTYAYPWITQFCLIEIEQRGSTIKAPNRGRRAELLKQANAVRAGLKALTTPVEQRLMGREKQTPDELVADSEEYDILFELIAQLSERHNEVLTRRLAGETLESISRSLGITRERVRQIQDSATLHLQRLAGERRQKFNNN